MAQVNITFQDVDQAGKMLKLIAFEGQLDETNVDAEAQKIYQVIEEMPEPNLILDFAGLEYMNSKSIGYVTDWYSKAAAKNGKIIIARPKANIMDILKVVGITQIINIHDNLDEAKLAFSGTAAEAPVTAPAAATPEAPVVSQASVPEQPAVPPESAPPTV